VRRDKKWDKENRNSRGSAPASTLQDLGRKWNPFSS
jgi:hypothetical protein